MTVTVWEKLDGIVEEREFEAPEGIENARQYCQWANDNAGQEIYFPYNPTE